MKSAYGLIGLTLTGHFGGIWAGQLQLLDASTTRENTWVIASAQIMREAIFKTALFRTSNPNPLVLKVEAAQNDQRRKNIGFYYIPKCDQ